MGVLHLKFERALGKGLLDAEKRKGAGLRRL
jgi:hypothetical protein